MEMIPLPPVSDGWFQALFGSNPQPMTIYDLDTLQFLAVNDAATRHYGYSRQEFLELTLFDIRHPEDIPALLESIAATRQESGSGFHSSGVWRHLKKDGSIIYIEIARHPIMFEGRKCICTLINDVTERRLMERALKQSEASLKEAQRIAHLGSWDWNITSNTIQWSEESYRILGKERHSTTDSPSIEVFLSCVYPEDKAMVAEAIQSALIGQNPCIMEHRILCQGELKYVRSEGHVTFDRNHRPARMFGTIQDITEQKQAEIELKESRRQFRELSAFLQSALEENRTSIARELHDELGQSLTALDMGISWVAAKLKPTQVELRDKLNSLKNLVNQTIDSIQRITTDLRPPALDDLGPAAAIEGLLEEFQDRTGIEFELKLSQEEFDLDDQISTAVFRILQEALTNVMRHANASKVNVTLSCIGNEVILTISDNGCGFPLTESSKKTSLGLLGIRERARLLGGAVEIRSSLNTGTAIKARIPMS